MIIDGAEFFSILHTHHALPLARRKADREWRLRILGSTALTRSLLALFIEKQLCR